MNKSPYFLFLFSALFFFIGSSIYLYGFTSSPSSSMKVSQKANPYVTEMRFKDQAQKSIYEKQWFPTQSNQVVFMILDSLPYFYAVNEEEQQKKSDLKKQGSSDPNIFIPSKDIPFQSLLDTFLTSQDNTVLLKGYAHPPTYTTTRTRAILQGNIPSYDQLSTNLGSRELKQDSTFLQAKINNPFKGQDRDKILCYGSHLLHTLYPNIFDRGHFVGEVNFYLKLKDDIQQYGHVEKEQLENNDWVTMLVHFDGIDAASHLVDSLDSYFLEQMQAVNQLVKNVISNIKNSKVNEDQTIIIVSDHGINYNVLGHHGGYSSSESNSLIFGYSKSEFITKSKKDIGQVMDREFLVGSDTFQINATPTYCMLLGIPIPYNNVGMIQPDFFLDKPIVDDFVIANNFYTNFRQILDNFNTIVQGLKGEFKQLQEIITFSEEVKQNYNNLFIKEGDSEELKVDTAKLKGFVQLCQNFSIRIASIIQNDFQQVRIEDMILGFVIHILLIIFTLSVIAVLNWYSKKSKYELEISYPHLTTLIKRIQFLVAVLAVVGLMGYFVLEHSKIVILEGILSSLFLFIMILYVLFFFKSTLNFSLSSFKEFLNIQSFIDFSIFAASVALYLMTRTTNDLFNISAELYEKYFQRISLALVICLVVMALQKEITKTKQFCIILIKITSIPMLIKICTYYNANVGRNIGIPRYYDYLTQFKAFKYYFPLVFFICFFVISLRKIWSRIFIKANLPTKALFFYFHLAQGLSITLFYLCQWDLIKIDQYQTTLPVSALYHTILLEATKMFFFYKNWLPKTTVFLKSFYFFLSSSFGVACVLEYNSLIQVPIYFIIMLNFLHILTSLRKLSWISTTSILFFLSQLFFYLSGHMEYLEEIHAQVFQFGVLDESSLLIPILNGVVNTLYYFLITCALIPFFVILINKKSEEVEMIGIFSSIFGKDQENQILDCGSETDIEQDSNYGYEFRKNKVSFEFQKLNYKEEEQTQINDQFFIKLNLYSLTFISHILIAIFGSDLRNLLDPMNTRKEDIYIPNYLFTMTYLIFFFIMISINQIIYRNKTKPQTDGSLVENK